MSSPGVSRSLSVWHAYGAWMESFVPGRQHRHVISVNPARDADGWELCDRNWPRAHEVPLAGRRDIVLIHLAQRGRLRVSSCG
jgi:hypothetical protein